MLLYNDYEGAVQRLLKTGKAFNALLLSVDLYLWEKAFEIAKQSKLLDVFSYKRTKYLKKLNLEEKNEAYQKLEPFNEQAVKQKIQDLRGKTQ